MHLITYSYFWTEKDSDKINLKIITDSVEAHEQFVKTVIEKYAPDKFCREYINEIDVTKLSKLDNLIKETSLNDEN